MSKKPLKVIAGAPDQPLVIGDIEIDCYVLEDRARVLTQGGFLTAIGRAEKAKGGYGVKRRRVDDPPSFLAARNLIPFISKDLIKSTAPIPFRSRRIGYGYRAELLPQVCEVYLQARDSGCLLPSQVHIAQRADILMRGLATVGIIALVDEATGYQEIRDRKALQIILDKYLLAERAKWAKRFPDEFYKEIFRLRDWEWQGMKVNRPSVVGHYTNDIVWDRLAPGVHEELKRLNPKTERGRRKSLHHQWLTEDIGHAVLQKHLNGVIVLMRSVVRSKGGWDEFRRRLQRVFPKINTNLDLPLEDE